MMYLRILVGFIRASVDAAVQYLSLGKTRRALAIYAHALTAVNDAEAPTISDDVHISLLLHYAEALALCGDGIKRYDCHKKPSTYSTLRLFTVCSSTKRPGKFHKLLKVHKLDQRPVESIIEFKFCNGQHWRPKCSH